MTTRPTFTEDPERYCRAPRTMAQAFDYLAAPTPPRLDTPEPKTLPHEWALYGISVVAVLVVLKVVL